MIYANYEYYSGTYMGSVSEENFLRLAVRASSFLDYYTQNRAKDNAEMDAVKMCWLTSMRLLRRRRRLPRRILRVLPLITQKSKARPWAVIPAHWRPAANLPLLR